MIIIIENCNVLVHNQHISKTKQTTMGKHIVQSTYALREVPSYNTCINFFSSRLFWITKSDRANMIIITGQNVRCERKQTQITVPLDNCLCVTRQRKKRSLSTTECASLQDFLSGNTNHILSSK